MDKHKSEKRRYAKQLLTHYFIHAKVNSSQDWNHDCISEIESIVDLIIDAAIVETIKELRDKEQIK